MKLAFLKDKIRYQPKKQTLNDQLKQERGKNAAYMATSTFFKSEAGDAVYLIAKLQRTLTAEEVRKHLTARGVVTGNWRSLGAIMTAAQRAGIIQPTNNFRMSNVSTRNNSPVRVWKSRIYDGE